MNNFKAGEVVVGHSFQVFTEMNGVEGMILEDLGIIQCTLADDALKDLFEAHCYVIEWQTGETDMAVMKCNLKRKIPPTEFKGETIVMEMFDGRIVSQVDVAEDVLEEVL